MFFQRRKFMYFFFHFPFKLIKFEIFLEFLLTFCFKNCFYFWKHWALCCLCFFFMLYFFSLIRKVKTICFVKNVSNFKQFFVCIQKQCKTLIYVFIYFYVVSKISFSFVFFFVIKCASFFLNLDVFILPSYTLIWFWWDEK